MTHLDIDLRLLPDEDVVSITPAPSEPVASTLPLGLIVDTLSDSKCKLPIATLDTASLDTASLGGDGLELAREALIMSSLVAEELPEITEATVRQLASWQATAPHDQIGRIPNAPAQFGAVDVTPLFISAVARAAKARPEFLREMIIQTDGETRSLAHCLNRSLEWLWSSLKNSPSGMLEATMGYDNHWPVWQHSADAYSHADGRLARGVLIPIEVQAFVYDALMDIADLVRTKLFPGSADYVWARAQKLRRDIIEKAWLVSPEAGAYFAAGIERDNGKLVPLTTRTANMGLLLNTRLLDGNAYERYVHGIIAQLFSTDGLMGSSGIRSLAGNEMRFRPDGRHTGSVWPWQNFFIAQGLRRRGRSAQAAEVEQQMLSIADLTHCAPQYVQGSHDFRPQLTNVSVELRSPDGYGEYFNHMPIEPPQNLYGPTVFGLYALQLREGGEGTLDVAGF